MVDGGTRPVLRKHHGPLRIQKGFTPEGPQVWHQIVVHPPGGIASGDRLSIDIEVHPGAHALLTSPGAAKWYRAREANEQQAKIAQQDLTLVVRAGAILEWLPMESLFFDRACAQLTTQIRLEDDANVMALEVGCLGRPSAGELFSSGNVNMLTQIEQNGALVFHESATLDEARRHASAGLNGHPAWGTLLCVSPRLVAALAELDMRQWQASLASRGVAATFMRGLLIIRWRGERADQGMQVLRAVWAELRPLVIGRPAIMPRIWAT
jgi:urease accessory protein